MREKTYTEYTIYTYSGGKSKIATESAQLKENFFFFGYEWALAPLRRNHTGDNLM